MGKILNYLKKNRVTVPIGLGLVLAKIPYTNRPGIGGQYRKQKNAIMRFDGFSQKDKEDYIYRSFINIFSHAYNNVKFYKDLYTKYNITPADIKSFDDINKVPVISKDDLIGYPLEDRSFNIENRMIVNTGGSSGKPFSFYMDPSRYGNEWAHIHNMWSKLGFKPSDLKLSFDGRVKKVNNKIVYDFARNSLLYDIYGDPSILSPQILKLLRRYPIKYLHGYPSAIFEFACYCEQFDPALMKALRTTLKGAFLSSEFPSPHYRKKIEEVFQIPTQSFYGHTETCVLAVENIPFEYDVYQTYGYAESVLIKDSYNLVGTSYFNFASPLIRYNTSDLIKPLSMCGDILSTFSIKEGRSGEYIIDRNGHRISLTGLIFGRHHELFNYCEHLQVYQQNKGKAIILYVSKDMISHQRASELFDSKNVDIDFEFIRMESPILSSAGKATILVKEFVK